MVDGSDKAPRNLATLGVCLQAFHLLFGITAIMGMLINHVQIEKTVGTIYHSQIRWQLVTFWLGAALYAAAFFYGYKKGVFWPVIVVLCFCVYRILVSAYHLHHKRPIERLF